MLFVCWEWSTNLIHVKHLHHPLAISPDCVVETLLKVYLLWIFKVTYLFICLFSTISKLASMLQSCLSFLHTRITDFCNYNWFKIYSTNYDIEKRNGQINCPNLEIKPIFLFVQKSRQSKSKAFAWPIATSILWYRRWSVLRVWWFPTCGRSLNSFSVILFPDTELLPLMHASLINTNALPGPKYPSNMQYAGLCFLRAFSSGELFIPRNFTLFVPVWLCFAFLGFQHSY